jgi:hypothetical protein
LASDGRRRAARAALVLALLATAALLREPLGRWWFPEQGAAADVAAAESALAEGDAGSAAAALSRIAARDPDHAALPGLRQRWQAAALQALDAALAVNDEPSAQRWLATLRAAGVAPQALQARELQLFLGVNAAAREDQLRRARARELQQPDEALALYRWVLQAEPGNAVAADGRRRLLQVRVQAALAHAGQGQDDAAAALLRAVAADDPLHPGLAEAARWYGEQGRAFPLSAASSPQTPTVATDDQLALAWRGRADEALGRGELPAARAAWQAAERLQPGHPDNRRLKARLDTLRAGDVRG